MQLLAQRDRDGRRHHRFGSVFIVPNGSQHITDELYRSSRTLALESSANGPITVIVPGIDRVFAPHVMEPNDVQQEDADNDPSDFKADGSIHKFPWRAVVLEFGGARLVASRGIDQIAGWNGLSRLAFRPVFALPHDIAGTPLHLRVNPARVGANESDAEKNEGLSHQHPAQHRSPAADGSA